MIDAQTVIGMCERFGCLPSQLYAESGDLLRMVGLVDRARRGGGV